MAREMNMPVDADKQSQDQGGARAYSKIFKMLPKEDGAIATNKLFVNLFRPNRFTKFGFMPEDLWTYYLRIPIHYLREESDDSDYPTLTLVVCKEKFGDYLETVIKVSNPFKAEANVAGKPNLAKCPCCQEEQRWWGKFNTRREELGIGRKQAKEMSKEDYKAIADKDSTLQSFKREAFNWSPNWRHILSVMDVAKYLGEKPMDEGEEGVDQQLYFAPKKIWDALYDKLQAGYKFYDLQNPRLLLVKRDNTKSAFRCEYSLEVAAEPVVFEEPDMEYLLDESTVPDPSSEVEFMSYEEMAVRFDISEAISDAPAEKVAAPTEPEPPAEKVAAPTEPEPPAEPKKEEPPAATPTRRRRKAKPADEKPEAKPEPPSEPKKEEPEMGIVDPPAERPKQANTPAEPSTTGKPAPRTRKMRSW